MHTLLNSINDMYILFIIQKDIHISFNTIDDMYVSFIIHIHIDMLLYDIYSLYNFFIKHMRICERGVQNLTEDYTVYACTSCDSIDDIYMLFTVQTEHCILLCDILVSNIDLSSTFSAREEFGI